jgi:hypothetical protein
MNYSASFRRVALCVLACFVVLLGFAAVAEASQYDDVYKDCTDNQVLNGSYSKAHLRGALQNVPSDADEYYGCSALINAALIDKVTKKKGTSDKFSGPKGGKAALKAASVNDLTTKKQRKKIAAKVAKETAVDKAVSPITAVTSPDIKKAAGQTLASSAAPSTPTSLIIAVVVLVLLILADLAGRLGKIPRVSKLLPKSGRRDNG